MKSTEKKKKTSEEKGNCPYLKIIKVFKSLPEYHKENKDRFVAITNRSNLLSSIKKQNSKLFVPSDEKNVFDKIKEVNEEVIPNKIDEKNSEDVDSNISKEISKKEYDPNLYLYNPFPNYDKPILFIAVISFHHKKGSIVEYTYPSKEDLLKNNKNLSFLIENTEKTKENLIDELFFQLTCVCLPDGIHTSNRDSQFFIIQDYKYPLYGISCYEQMKSFRDDSVENTRFSIQKSICIISFFPLYSSLYSKLYISVEAFFNQESLQDKQIINQLYDNYLFENNLNYNISEMTFIFAARKLLCFTKEKIFMILKMILLEKKIFIFSTVSGNVCSFIYNLISLIPGQIVFNFQNSQDINNYLGNLEMYGFPLKIFNENYKLFPLVTLFDIDKIESKYENYLIGTTNQLLLDSAMSKKKYDLVINIDTEKIIPFYNRKMKENKNNKELKELKENKDMYEMTKTEKNMYNLIKEKLKEFDIKYNMTQWINGLNDDNIFNNNKIIIDSGPNHPGGTSSKNSPMKFSSVAYESIDNFIRNEFEIYFKKIIMKLSLCLNIVKNNSIIKYLDFQKENAFTQFILDEKGIKKIFKLIFPSNSFVEFLYHFTQVKSFNYWAKEHYDNLFYLDQNITSDKVLLVFNEDGSIYEGEYKHGKPNGRGSLTSYDNKTIYDGEWKNGKKEGIGNLIVTDKFNYSGPFENDLFSGSNGVLCDSKGNLYEGDFENGKFNGYGRYKMCNGDSYVGEFKNGLFEGKGQYNDSEGNVFDGEFKNGKKDGKGCLLKSNGEKIEGTFRDDNFVE